MCDQLVPCIAAISPGVTPSLSDQDEADAGCLHPQPLLVMADEANHLFLFDRGKAQLPLIHRNCPINVNQLIDTVNR